MILLKNRIEREKIIVLSMIRMYCSSKHKSEEALCTGCASLWNYVKKRLDKCRFGQEKPVCKECIVHCYESAKREQIRLIMRWSGPRMVYRHPEYAIIHVMDKLTSPNK
jgi:hypothetical protein